MIGSVVSVSQTQNGETAGDVIYRKGTSLGPGGKSLCGWAPDPYLGH